MSQDLLALEGALALGCAAGPGSRASDLRTALLGERWMHCRVERAQVRNG